MEYFLLVSFNFSLKYAMGLLSWLKTTPIATPLASHLTWNVFPKFGKTRIGRSVIFSFSILKYKITEQPILVLPHFGKTFQVRCDASGVAIEVVLSQDNRPIAYFSENLNDTKRNYSTYDKEFHSIIQALKKWRHYLVPKEFVLYSDN